MSGINAFIISFCSSCILLGCLYMLCPSGNMNAPVKYIFCLCFVCCVLGTAIGIKPPDFLVFNKTQDIPILTEENSAIAAQTVIGQALTQQNINFTKIAVDTNKKNDGSIIISKITVYTTEPYQKVLDVIESDSYEVVVINE